MIREAYHRDCPMCQASRGGLAAKLTKSNSAALVEATPTFGAGTAGSPSASPVGRPGQQIIFTLLWPRRSASRRSSASLSRLTSSNRCHSIAPPRSACGNLLRGGRGRPRTNRASPSPAGTAGRLAVVVHPSASSDLPPLTRLRNDTPWPKTDPPLMGAASTLVGAEAQHLT
jgi:hypothetical protein